MFFAVDGDGVLLPGNVRVPRFERFTFKHAAHYKTRRIPLTQNGFPCRTIHPTTGKPPPIHPM